MNIITGITGIIFSMFMASIYKKCINSFNSGFVEVCKQGNTKLALLMIQKQIVKPPSLRKMILPEIIEYEYEKDFQDGLLSAYKFGHKELVLSIIEYSYYNVNQGLMLACKLGSMDIALLMIEKGAYKLKEGIKYAYHYKNMHLVLLMIEKGANMNKCNITLNDLELQYFLSKGLINPKKHKNRIYVLEKNWLYISRELSKKINRNLVSVIKKY